MSPSVVSAEGAALLTMTFVARLLQKKMPRTKPRFVSRLQWSNKSSCSPHSEVEHQIKAASSDVGRLSKRVFLKHNLAIPTKVAVYRAVGVSVMLYGCEAWTLYRRHIKTTEFGMMTQFNPLKFRKPMMAAAAIFKNWKLTYLLHGLSDFNRIWHSYVFWPSWPLRMLKIFIVKSQDGGSHHLEKSKNCNNSASGWTDRHLHTWCVPLLENCNFKNPTWRRPPFWKFEKSP